MTETANPILPTTHGYIKGVKRTTIYGDEYYSFEKIPYAKRPLGDFRFKAPQPADAWADVLDCTDFAEKPLQKNLITGEIEGSEDCLYLNVYVKTLHTKKPLPVLVYIYGGAFQNGEATRNLLSPDYFMLENVILVTLNYRLGPLGFLSLKDPSLEVPGNAGLKDQLTALLWFKNNCINFNGDASNITLFGESAGSASTHYLMLTEKTKGVFHKAILQSGTVFNSWAEIPSGNYAYRLAVFNGFSGSDNDKDVFEYLMQLDGAKLVGVELMTAEERLNDLSYVFGPTVEPYESPSCIVPANPREMLKTAWSNNIPLLIGGTSFEGLLSYMRVKANPGVIKILGERPELLAPRDIKSKKSTEELKNFGLKMIGLHFGDKQLNFDNVLLYLDLMSYRRFWHAFHRSVLARLAYATQPTYLYRFDFDSPTFNLYRKKYCGSDTRGVAHADDLSYLFYGTHSHKLELDTAEYKTIKRMIGMWTSFARTSNPNCPEIQPKIWYPVRQNSPNQCLNISYNLEFLELPEAAKLAHWDDLYTKEHLY